MSGEGPCEHHTKCIDVCVCVLPRGGGELLRGELAVSLRGHAGRRASLKKRHGEGGDTVRRQAGSPSPWGDPELEGRPLWPSSQPSPPCHPRAGTHPAGSAHDFFFFSFSACSQCGGEPSDLGGWSRITKIPPKHAQSPGGFSQSPGGTRPTGTPGAVPLPRGAGQAGSRAAAGCGGSLQAVALRASSQALFRVEQLNSPRQRGLGNAGPSKPPSPLQLQPRGRLPAAETPARGTGFLGAVGLQHSPTGTSARPPRTPQVPSVPTGGISRPSPPQDRPTFPGTHPEDLSGLGGSARGFPPRPGILQDLERCTWGSFGGAALLSAGSAPSSAERFRPLSLAWA